MSKSGITPKSFSIQGPTIATLVDPKRMADAFQKVAGGPQGLSYQVARLPPAFVLDPSLSQALAARQSAVKAALITAYVTRNYLEAHVPTCRLPDVEPKPGLVEPKPGLVVCPSPVATERFFTGDDLVRQLDAGGAAIGGSNGAYGVKSGRAGDLSSEIDPGESLTFHVPANGRAHGGRVTIDKLYNDGPDPNRQEQGTIEVYDGDWLVKTIDIRGYSASNGQQSVEIDVPFTKLVFKAKGEFKGGGNHSDFAIRDVTIRQTDDSVQALPYPNNDQQLHILPYPNEPVYVGAPVNPPDVIVGPVAPPSTPKDPIAAIVSRGLARIANLIDRSKLPENVQNALLDRIATLLAEIKQPRDPGSQWTTALTGIASLIQILDHQVPRHVARKIGGGAEHVMDHLKTMLFNAALGRGDVLDGTSHVA